MPSSPSSMATTTDPRNPKATACHFTLTKAQVFIQPPHPVCILCRVIFWGGKPRVSPPLKHPPSSSAQLLFQSLSPPLSINHQPFDPSLGVQSLTGGLVAWDHKLNSRQLRQEGVFLVHSEFEGKDANGPSRVSVPRNSTSLLHFSFPHFLA